MLSRSIVLDSKRTRIMAATVDLVAERGREKVGVKEMVQGGGVARKTFYEVFTGSEDAFQRTCGWASGAAVEAVKMALREDRGDFASRLDTGLEALLAFVRAEPAAARFVLLDGPAVAPSVVESDRRRWAKALRLVPGIREELIVEGLWWLLYRHSASRYGEDPGYLLEGMRAFVTATFDPAPVKA